MTSTRSPSPSTCWGGAWHRGSRGRDGRSRHRHGRHQRTVASSEGWRGGAGEVGHLEVSPDGPGCWCGRWGCLEAVASEPALVRDTLATTGRLASPDDLAELAEQDRSAWSLLLERAGALVGGVIARSRPSSTPSGSWSPARVSVSGPGISSHSSRPRPHRRPPRTWSSSHGAMRPGRVAQPHSCCASSSIRPTCATDSGHRSRPPQPIPGDPTTAGQPEEVVPMRPLS